MATSRHAQENNASIVERQGRLVEHILGITSTARPRDFTESMQYVDSNFKHHRFLEANPVEVERTLGGVIEKLRVHALTEKAARLEGLLHHIFRLKLPESNVWARRDTHYAVLKLLLCLSERPTTGTALPEPVYHQGAPRPWEDGVDWRAVLADSDGEEVGGGAGEYYGEPVWSDDSGAWTEEEEEGEGEEEVKQQQQLQQQGKWTRPPQTPGPAAPRGGRKLQTDGVALDTGGGDRSSGAGSTRQQQQRNMANFEPHLAPVPSLPTVLSASESVPSSTPANCTTTLEAMLCDPCRTEGAIAAELEAMAKPLYPSRRRVLTEEQAVRETIWMLNGACPGHTGGDMMYARSQGGELQVVAEVRLAHLSGTAFWRQCVEFARLGSELETVRLVRNAWAYCVSTGTVLDQHAGSKVCQAFGAGVNTLLREFSSALAKQESTLRLMSHLAAVCRPFERKLSALGQMIAALIEKSAATAADAPSTDCCWDNYAMCQHLLGQLQVRAMREQLLGAKPTDQCWTALFAAAMGPWCNMAARWTLQGVLEDPGREFPVVMVLEREADPAVSSVCANKRGADHWLAAYQARTLAVGVAQPEFLVGAIALLLAGGKAAEALAALGHDMSADTTVLRRQLLALLSHTTPPPSSAAKYAAAARLASNCLDDVASLSGPAPARLTPEERLLSLHFFHLCTPAFEAAARAKSQRLSDGVGSDTAVNGRHRGEMVGNAGSVTVTGNSTLPSSSAPSSTLTQTQGGNLSTGICRLLVDMARHSSARLMNSLLTKHDLSGLLTRLRGVVLLSNGGGMSEFSHAFFEMIERHEGWHFAGALDALLAETVPAPELRLYVDLGASGPAHLPTVFEGLEVESVAPWPLCLVTSAPIMERYSRCFRVLLQLKRARWALETLRLKGPDSDFRDRGEEHRFHLLRARLLYRVRLLQDCVQERAIRPLEEAFAAAVGKFTSLDDLLAAHAAFVDAVSENCLLRERQAPLLDAVRAVLAGALGLRVLWRAVVERTKLPTGLYPATYHLDVIEQDVEAASKFLAGVLQGFESRGGVPGHLRELGHALAGW